MSKTITLASIIQRNENIIDANIDGETVMMSIENGEYYGMDSIASRIWGLLETSGTVGEICTQLQQNYDVSERQCQEDVLAFLNDLAEQNTIVVNA